MNPITRLTNRHRKSAHPMTDHTHTHTLTDPGLAMTMNPNDLVIAANVRRNVALDPDFVDSIREHGILVPISVWWDDIAGAFQVLDGQRRTLAAREIGLASVPIWTVSAIAGEDQRITQQLTVNDRRKALTDADETAAVHDLALFGLTADTIRRRTSIPKARVEQALAVAANPHAVELLATAPVTLEHAAAIAEFADRPDVVERLTQVAVDAPTRLEWEIQHYRGEAPKDAARAAEELRLNTAGFAVLTEYPALARWARIQDLIREDGTDVPAEEITPAEDIAAYAQLYSNWVTPKGRIVDEDDGVYDVDPDNEDDVEDLEDEAGHYEYEARATFYTSDPAAHGWKHRYGSGSAHQVPVPTLDEKRAARQRSADWKAATAVRIGFLQALTLNRITTVRQPAALMLIALHAGELLPHRGFSAMQHTEEWLSTATAGDRDYSDYHGFRSYLEKNPTRAINLALTLALTDIEDALAGGTLGKPQEDANPKVARYLTALTVLGHILTPVEERAAGIEPADALDDDAAPADAEVTA